MSSNQTLRFRGVAFVLLAAFMFFGPFYRQVLGGQSEVFRKWAMFRGKGWALCAANYWARNSSGAEVLLEKKQFRGIKMHPSVLHAYPRIRTVQEGMRVGMAVCKQYPQIVDLRMELRCPRTGEPSWVVLEDRGTNVCL